MDTERIRLAVFQRTGKSIDPDDPFFVAVAMLSAVTEDMEHKHTSVLADLRKENSAWRKVEPQIIGLVDALREVKSKSIDDGSLLVELKNLIRRGYSQEVEVTRWLTRAHKKLDSFFQTQISLCLISGLLGGVIVAVAQRYF